jgi:hypothetical protein
VIAVPKTLRFAAALAFVGAFRLCAQSSPAPFAFDVASVLPHQGRLLLSTALINPVKINYPRGDGLQ